jgi:cation diffusion facilitator family transporter
MAQPKNNLQGCGCGSDYAAKLERRTLWLVLWINATMFLLEFSWGWRAGSSGLLADALDMLADAVVYTLSLVAVGRSLKQQRRAAELSGWLQIALAVLVLADAVRRFIGGSEPLSGPMMVVGLLALIANVVCLFLVRRHRDGGVHMHASVIFSTNDTVANVGVIVAGVLVAWSGSSLPDLLIGAAISLLVLRGGQRILHAAGSAA